MKFRTEIAPIDYPEKFSIEDSILTIGSCFANTMGELFEQNKMACFVNPFGTIYDPLSMTRLLLMAMQDQEPDQSTSVKSEGVWKNLLLHSSFSGLSKNELNLKIRAQLGQVKKQLAKADWLMMTFGTAFVYEFKETNQLVANCQKLPAKYFTKNLASHATIFKDFEDFLKELRAFNPKIKILLTVSPVRHIRDGLTENSVSKSVLRILCNTLSQEHDAVYYYPAYEIVLDDLRDYRFYKDDLIHPNSQATDYIWKHFTASMFNSELIDFINQWKKVYTSLNHRPFNPGSYEHQQFLKKLLGELELLSSRVDLKKEIARVKDAIIDVQ
jgi:hypothetical protein